MEFISFAQAIQTLGNLGLTVVLYLWFDKKLEKQSDHYEEKLRATNAYYRTEIDKLSDKYDTVNRELGRREGVQTVADTINNKLDLLLKTS